MQFVYSGNGSPVATNTTARELLSLYLDTSTNDTYVAVNTTNPYGFQKLLQTSSNVVTSVNASGGSTGLSFSNGPVTSIGTLILGGTLSASNGGTGLTSLGTGVAAWLGTPSSANLASAVSDETGSGALVFAVQPSLTGATNNGVSVGYLYLPNNDQSANYTTVLGDSGKLIRHPSTDANARTFTIPANSSVAYPIGTELTFTNLTSQVLSITISTDTLYLAGTTTTGTRSLAQNGICKATKVATSTWVIAGSGLT